MAGEIKSLKFSEGQTVSNPNSFTLSANAFDSYANDAAFEAANGAGSASDAYYNTTTNKFRGFNTAWGDLIHTVGAYALTDTTDSSSSVTGALTIAGGVGIAKKLYVGTDLNVGGNMTISGTLATLNTTNTDIKDQNITLNKGGNQATADDSAGLTIEMSDATDGSIIYDKDAVSRFRIGEVGSEVEAVTISGAQTITNKTITQTGNSISGLTHGGSVDNPTTAHGTTSAIAGISDTQTLTNKTITQTGNSISGLTHGGSVDNPSVAHGATGAVVGTTNAQVLTLKDYDGGTATNTSRLTLPKDTTVNLALLTNKEATIAYDTTLDEIVKNDGTGWTTSGGGGGAVQSAAYHTFGGHNTGNVIPYMTTLNFSDGSGVVTVTSDSTDGFTLTAIVKCSVVASYSGQWNAAVDFGWSINADTTTAVQSLSPGDRLAETTTGGNNFAATATVPVVLQIGDVLAARSQTSAVAGIAARQHINFTATAL